MARPLRSEYRRASRPSTEQSDKPKSAENEIRVTASHGQHSYISYAIAILNGEEGKTKNDTVKISGMGGAIFNAVNIAEIVKRRVADLHQITEIASEIVKDEYEPLDRNVHPDNLIVERKVSTILITLSRNQLDAKNAGYQAPLDEDQVTAQEKREPGESRNRGGERRPRGVPRGSRGGSGSRGGARGNGRGSSRGGARGSGRGGEVDRRDQRS